MTSNINAVNLAFPFNLSLPPKTDYANYSLYKQVKEPILNEFMQAYLVQNSDNHLLLSLNIQVYIEGILPPHKVELIQENLRHKLSKLENHPCEIKQLLV